MNIYKLIYPTRELAITDLLSKGIIFEDLKWQLPTHAIVELGNTITQEAIYYADGTLMIPTRYGEEIKFDIMTEEEYDFADNVIEPITPSHSFAGHEPIITNPLINDNE